jgi:hypothetical protein
MRRIRTVNEPLDLLLPAGKSFFLLSSSAFLSSSADLTSTSSRPAPTVLPDCSALAPVRIKDLINALGG